jgi:hypothetical protein
VIAYFVREFEAVKVELTEGFDSWYILAYALYATVESFGLLAVATFWSSTNSTLALDDAERFMDPSLPSPNWVPLVGVPWLPVTNDKLHPC